jgi:hypothetical protein
MWWPFLVNRGQKTHELRYTVEVPRSLNLVTWKRIGYIHCIRSHAATGTHYVGGWVDPMTGLEVVAETNTSVFPQKQNTRPSIMKMSNYWLIYSTSWHNWIFHMICTFEETNCIFNLLTYICPCICHFLFMKGLGTLITKGPYFLNERLTWGLNGLP